MEEINGSTIKERKEELRRQWRKFEGNKEK